MSRIDAWEKRVKQEVETITIGAARNFLDKYEVGITLGSGGFGTVKVVTEKETGTEYACKTICKLLEEQGVGGNKQTRHIDNVRREIAVLRKLTGTLNVAQFKQVYEDDTDIHIVMEYCRGGELWHRIGSRHYTERTVASFTRAVLRTLSQCHSHRILHRDIKPGNFMLLNDEYRAPLKAIDFGLAVFYEPSDLPRTDLGLEGTPWFMAPEVMSSEVYPSSDIWAAGVMTYQLLSGQMPFDDRRRPNSPALSVIWKAVLTQEPSFNGKAWDNISEPAKAFVKRLLIKDPKGRPTAKEALQDPWLQGNSLERNQGRPLDATVVQRIQRYAQTNVLKRTIFELIAEELIKSMTHQLAHTPESSTHGGSHPDKDKEPQQGSPERSLHEATPDAPPKDPPNSSWSPFRFGLRRKRSLAQELTDTGSAAVSIPRHVGTSAHGGLEYHRAFGSVPNGAMLPAHEAGYWRKFKTALEVAKQRRASSMHGGHQYMRATAKDRAVEREKHRKAARLALDTSAHAGSEYHDFMRDSCNKDEEMAPPEAQQNHSTFPSGSASQTASDSASNAVSEPLGRLSTERTRQALLNILPSDAGADSTDASRGRVKPSANVEAGKRGQSQYAQFLRRSSVEAPLAQEEDGQTLRRRSSSLGADHSSEARGSALNLERQPSKVHFVPAHQSGDGVSDSADHVQEAASHREQMSGVAEGCGEPQARPQLQRKSFDRQLTFQEMLRQQIQAHSHHVSPEEGVTPDPSTHLSSPASTPPASNRRSHVSFQDMLRQQLAQQTMPEVAGDPGGHPPAPPQLARVSYQDMLRQQSYGTVPLLEPESHGTAPAVDPIDIAGTSEVRPDVNTAESSNSGSNAGGHSEDACGVATPGRSQHGSRAQVTPGGLRLYDAQGLCSIVPLKELRQMMQKLRFSRDKPGIDVEQLAQGLQGLGFELAPSELGVLMHQISLAQHGHVAKPAFVASQVDWQDFQQNFKDQWLQCAQAAFASMDSGDKGHIKSSQLVSLLGTKLPAEEVEHAVEDALMEAGCGDMEDLDFNGFLKLLRVSSMDSLDSLDQYDSRVNSSLNLQSLDSNPSAHGIPDGHHQQLESVPE